MPSSKRRFSKYSLGLGYGYKTPITNRPIVLGNQKKSNTIKNIKIPNATSLKKILILILIGTALAGTVYWLYFSAFFKIKTIAIKYSESQEEMEELKIYFQKLVGKNLLRIDLENITNQIKKDHPELQKFETKKIFPRKIQIAFSKFSDQANVINITNKGNRKYIINEIGLAVKFETENPNLTSIRIFTEEFLDTKKEVLSKEKLDYILGAIQYFKDKFGMKILDADYLMQAHELHLRTEKYFFIWLDMEKSYAAQLQKLKKAVPRLDIYNMPLEYIDLRISGSNGEKIIFKRQIQSEH